VALSTEISTHDFKGYLKSSSYDGIEKDGIDLKSAPKYSNKHE
jgi:hypothetical protein